MPGKSKALWHRCYDCKCETIHHDFCFAQRAPYPSHAMGTKHPARRCVLTGVLDLSFNEIGEGGARALAASLSQPVSALLELMILLNAVVQKFGTPSKEQDWAFIFRVLSFGSQTDKKEENKKRIRRRKQLQW